VGRLLLCSRVMERGWVEMVHIRVAALVGWIVGLHNLVSAGLQFNLH
jgi:hypothetical protein